MKIKQIFKIYFILLLSANLSLAEMEEKKLSLEDCIISAIKNNFGAAVEVLRPEIAETRVSIAEQKFLPQLGFQYGRQRTNTASYSWIDAAGKVTEEYNDYAVQLIQEIPTGGSLTMSIYSYDLSTNRKFQTINPRYGSSLSFEFSQPLLKDFGFNISRREILVARTNQQISEAAFRTNLINIIYSVEEAYWNLVYSIENLKVRQQSLRLAQGLLAKNRREVEVGTLAPIEILSAEAEVATREADILQAEVLVKNNEDTLKTFINLLSEENQSEYTITPISEPVFEENNITIEDALMTGMENRPDLDSRRLELKNTEINLSHAKNQLLPNISLDASFWSPGTSGTQILYLNDDPLTDVVIGTVPGGASNALKDALGFKYQNWELGITLTFPIETIFSRAAYAQAKLNKKMALFNLKNQEQQVFLDIRNAVRTVQTNYKRVEAYKAARELALKKLEAEEKKLKVGLTTNYLVLQYQRDLDNAVSAELRAVIDYNLSLARLEQGMGTSLKSKNIRLTEVGSGLN
ncbi:MAG: TolC family protein [Candidatus Aminicenantes bacterium]|nr:TolC family protein [Candidatus Aminicenantes bacterium]